MNSWLLRKILKEMEGRKYSEYPAELYDDRWMKYDNLDEGDIGQILDAPNYQSPLKESLPVFRAETFHPSANTREYEEFALGQFRDRLRELDKGVMLGNKYGPTHTAVDPQLALSFSDPELTGASRFGPSMSMLYDINLPPGIKYARDENYPGTGVVLPPGQQFRINRVEQSPPGLFDDWMTPKGQNVMVVGMEALPQLLKNRVKK